MRYTPWIEVSSNALPNMPLAYLHFLGIGYAGLGGPCRDVCQSLVLGVQKPEVFPRLRKCRQRLWGVLWQAEDVRQKRSGCRSKELLPPNVEKAAAAFRVCSAWHPDVGNRYSFRPSPTQAQKKTTRHSIDAGGDRNVHGISRGYIPPLPSPPDQPSCSLSSRPSFNLSAFSCRIQYIANTTPATLATSVIQYALA